jgi:hypothetical protein
MHDSASSYTQRLATRSQMRLALPESGFAAARSRGYSGSCKWTSENFYSTHSAE